MYTLITIFCFLIIPIIWVLSSVYIAILAKRKGRIAVIFFLASMLFSPIVGLLLVAIEQPNYDVLGRKTNG